MPQLLPPPFPRQSSGRCCVFVACTACVCVCVCVCVGGGGDGQSLAFVAHLGFLPAFVFLVLFPGACPCPFLDCEPVSCPDLILVLSAGRHFLDQLPLCEICVGGDGDNGGGGG